MLLTRNYNNAQAIFKGIFKNTGQLQDIHPVFWKHDSRSERQGRIEANQISIGSALSVSVAFISSEHCPCWMILLHTCKFTFVQFCYSCLDKRTEIWHHFYGRSFSFPSSVVNSCSHGGSGSVTDIGLTGLLVRHLTASCQKITTKEVAEHKDKIYFEAAHSLMARKQVVNYEKCAKRFYAFMFIVCWDFSCCIKWSTLRLSLNWQKGCHVDWSRWHACPEA